MEAAEHMHHAAGILHEADVHELAEHLDREAGRIEHKVRQKMHTQDLHHVIGKLPSGYQKGEIGRLRHELEHLRRRVDELSEEIRR